MRRPSPFSGDRRWRTLQIAHDEQSLPGLRYAEARCIQYLDAHMVPELPKCFEQRFVAVPFAHVEHVLDDDPAGLEGTREIEDVACGQPAAFLRRPTAPGACMMGAFRRGQEKVNPAKAAEYGRARLIRQGQGHRTSLGEVCLESCSCKRACIHPADNLGSGRPCAVAAAAATAEEIKRSNGHENFLPSHQGI